MALLPFLFQLQRISQYYPSSLFLISLFLLSLLLLFITKTRPSAKLKLPPSPGRLPLIGNLHQLGTSFHRSFKVLSDKYGPLMLIHIGHAPVLVVSSVEMVKELIKKHDIAVSDRPVSTATNILFYGSKNMGFAPYGEYWKQARKITSQELLSHRRVQQFQFVREEEVAILVERIRRSSLSGNSVNLSEMALATANNIVSRCVTGQGFSEEDGQNKVAVLVKKVMTQVTAEFGVGEFVPWLSWVDNLTGFMDRLKSTAREMDSFLDQVIKDREALVKISGEFDTKYMVDVLLQIQNDGECDFDITRDNVKAFLLDMLGGGTDSTSVVVEWLMAELVRNPRVMKKVQEEVRRVIGKKPQIDMNDINRMDYLKCVIKESFRLHPPGPLLVQREISGNIRIGGCDVPAKTRLFINAWAIQRDPSIWERPEEFFPERFENNQVDFRDNDFELIPFGVGRRRCPGMAFGVASIEYITANLLYWFDWKLPGGDGAFPKDLDMSEGYGVLVHRKTPLHLVPKPYSP